MENHHAINGKIHYFYGHFPLQTVSTPGRVCLSFAAVCGFAQVFVHPLFFPQLKSVAFANQQMTNP